MGRVTVLGDVDATVVLGERSSSTSVGKLPRRGWET